ncbi:tetratricopeptide repeat protein [Treponema peruense]|uniref:Tetratricopeptide repeat-containing protein n=1 Tax=Treponema peruense TaxID=2787628 RepID=A0A7T3RFG0_9SPIR|nr:tetratricopeptide repeat protein [Treponema peruense]QQA02167.1 hypothetical protein IWA51_06215 [Treponema peruense]
MKAKRVSEKIVRRKNMIVVRIILLAGILSAVVLVSFFSYKAIHRYLFASSSVSAMYDNWELHSRQGYEKVYEISENIIQKKNFHNSARTFRGYSAFMLAEYETDNAKSQTYLDEAVYNLRIALQNCSKDALPQIEYMLGRTYFYKNKLSSYHYYSDLAVKYLNLALDHGYKSDDIPLLLGLSYASLGQTDESIAAFTEALLVRETDTLLFDIAKQYYNNGQGSASKQYLYRVISTTRNESLLEESRILLGQIYTDEGALYDAEKEFTAILEKNENSADAHYGLGVLYEKRGDAVRARAEWRKCLKIKFDHPGALQKMSEAK